MVVKLLHKIKIERTQANSSYEAGITPIPKPDKDTTKRKAREQFPL
jgi:hypothetical protein